MKFVADRPLADPRPLHASCSNSPTLYEPIQDGRIYIEKINAPFLYELKGTPAEYKAGLDYAIATGPQGRWPDMDTAAS